MKSLFYVAIMLLFINGKPVDKTNFSNEALNQQITTLDGDSIAFKDVIAKYKGKTIILDFWASWCADCVKALPSVKEFDYNIDHNDFVFITLSMDRNKDAWKKSVAKLQIPGDVHYFVPGGFKSAIGLSAELNWIPRYLVLDTKGNIQVFNTITINTLSQSLFDIR